LIRPFARFASVAALVALSLSAMAAAAQQQAPAAQEPAGTAPSAPAPATAPVFPKQDPSFFTATSPTKEAVNSFLQTTWGFDPNRMWQVQAILKTPVDGISKVIILLGDKSGKQKPSALQFFTLADGKHIIAGDDIVPFGDHPFADFRAQLQQRADGPYKGSASKDLEIVEFADFQCPHCKDAQANMEKLAVDFPKARIVFQNYPLVRLHPAALQAAEYGACVTKEGGSNAFFQFASAVFDSQDGLTSADGTTLTLNSAVKTAGLDPAKIADCAKSPAISAQVEASVKLAQDVNITSTPMLVINGRQVSANSAYETIKQIVNYQARLDGVSQ
jgi:protein-disulfide isomerase